ncbi:MAG: DEAD/DEAH box helicase [Malacoplasma sp.]|nr:DEAD/DEAH box helicase [Malacoplasma sp.]
MKTINLSELDHLLYSQQILEDGENLSNSKSPSSFSIDEGQGFLTVNCIVNNYAIFLKIEDNSVKNFGCGCDTFLVSNKFCVHIVYTIILYNNYFKYNLADLKSGKEIGFQIIPIIKTDEFGSKKIIIKLLFEFNYKKIYINNLKLFFESNGNFWFFPGLYIKDEQIEPYSLNLIYQLKKMLSKGHNIFADETVEIDKNYLDEWILFFKDNNLTFHFETNIKWTIATYYLDTYDYEFDIKLYKSKPNVNNKKKYILKIDKDYSSFYFLSAKYVYLCIYSLNSCKSSIYQYEIEKLETVESFCKNINKHLSKNEFRKLYNAIKILFNNHSKIVDSLFIVKNNLFKVDPILSVKVHLDKLLNVIVSKLDFIYDDKIYPYKPNETEFLKRERFLEKKLLEPLFDFFSTYNTEFNLFEIVEMHKFQKLCDWAKKMDKNDLYEIKFAQGLIFKPKQKKNFFVNSLGFDNNFLVAEWSLEGFDENEMLKILAAYQEKQKFVKLDNNKIINLDLDINFENFENELKIMNSSINQIRNSKIYINKLNTNYFIENHNLKNKEELKQYFEKVYCDNSLVRQNLPDNLQKTLKNYQIYGYLWLKKLLLLKAGGILADEMGLGKTIQVIALLSDLYMMQKVTTPTLVVCPSSLLYNWKTEFNRFAPYLKIAVIDGPQNERMVALKNCKDTHIILTSYHLLNRDIQIYKNMDFYLQIVDEAQKIKNHYTQFSNDSKQIKATHKIALTGTPIENNLLELWNIFDFLMPGFLFDYKTFKIIFQEKINNNDLNALNKLKTKIAPFILRRTKKEVLKELPEKAHKTIMSEFNEVQKQMYLTELNKGKIYLRRSILENSINKQGAYIFSMLTKLRQICCCPQLAYDNTEEKGTKLKDCLDLIRDLIANGDKILLFSQFTSMIDIISKELTKLNIKHFILTGSVNKKERIELVNDFNSKENIKVFLISLKAGGTGLNLTSANTVIHYDPWWNLSLENQAADRVHRIGQQKNVYVYKLIAKDSIEEKIIKLQESKREIIEQVLSDSISDTNNLNITEVLKILDIE